jgi:hypothetical protein
MSTDAWTEEYQISGDQRHASAAVMTNSETFCDADLECVSMFPPWCGAGGLCEKPQLSSLSWRRVCHVGRRGPNSRRSCEGQAGAATADFQASNAWLRRMRWVLAVVK